MEGRELDILDASTKSEGWDFLRGSRGRGPEGPRSKVVSLPPIDQHLLSVNRRGAPRGPAGLKAAKKTLEQLDSVLREPSEGREAPRGGGNPPPGGLYRARGSRQIYSES